MSALDLITKRDAPQASKPALISMTRGALHAALTQIESEFRAGDLRELDISTAEPGAPARVLTSRLWTAFGGREGG